MASDNLERDKIRNNIDMNYFVEAGAGSGKTSALVKRMASMVDKGIDISKICAITFTKAAANEFRARFMKELSDNPSDLRDKALNDIDLSFMGTLDSFCNGIVSEYPSISGIQSDSTLITGSELNSAIKRELLSIENGEYGDKILQDKISILKGYFKDYNEELTRIVEFIMDTYPTYVQSKAYPTSITSEIKKEKDELLKLLNILDRDGELYKYKGNKDSIGAWDNVHKVCFILNNKDWDKDLSDIIENLKKLKELEIHKIDIEKNIGREFPKYFAPKSKTFVFDLENDVLLINRLHTHRMRVLIDVAKECAYKISEKLQGAGYLTYHDYLVKTCEMLKEDLKSGGKIISHLNEKYSYYLLDEAQDTSPLQYEIFFYLTHDMSKKDPKTINSWDECMPRDGSLFIVGDPKQSIYRFRNADIPSYLKVKSLFDNLKNCEVLKLTSNFRSSKPMCEYFNEVFPNILIDGKYQSGYSPIPLDDKIPYTGTFGGVYGFCENKYKYEIVVELIKEIVKNPNFTIYDEEFKDVREINYRDIMIISRNKTGGFERHMKGLMDNDIPCKVAGKVPFKDCPALEAVTYIMEAILKPSEGNLKKVEELSGVKVERAYLKDTYLPLSKKVNPSTLFNRILEDLKVLDYVGTKNIECLLFALELLRDAEENGEVNTLKSGVDYLISLINNESDNERVLELSKNMDCVTLANVHKVKGLEAPIVILLGNVIRDHKPITRVDYSTTVPKGYVFGSGEKNSIEIASDFKNEFESESDAGHEEEKRLCYVAATRAKCALFIGNPSGNIKTINTQTSWPNLVNDSVIEIRYDENSPEIFHKGYGKVNPKTKVTKDDIERNRDVVLDSLKDNPKTYKLVLPSKIVKKKAEKDDTSLNSIDDDSNISIKKNVNLNDALIGTLTHRLMEIMVSRRRDTLNRDQLISSIMDEYDNPKGEYEAKLKEVFDTIISGGYEQDKNDAPKNLFDILKDLDEVYTEVRFSYYDRASDSLFDGVIDLIYTDDKGTHIVDYKTDRDLKMLYSKHKEQLDSYVKALKEIEGIDVTDSKIYHIDLEK